MSATRLINGTLAGAVAKILDENDGKTDGKISADVWNEFVKDKGGKEIKNSISLFDATNSITTYAVKGAKEQGVSCNELAKRWLNISKEAPTSNPELIQKINDEASELNFDIKGDANADLEPKDVSFVKNKTTAGAEFANKLKTQLTEHSWKYRAAVKLLNTITADKVAYVVSAYDGGTDKLIKDIGNVFMFTSMDAQTFVLNKLKARADQLGIEYQQSQLMMSNVDDIKSEINSLTNDIINKEKAILSGNDAYNTVIDVAKDFNEKIPAIKKQFDGANRLLAEIANMKYRPEILEGIDGDLRCRRMDFTDGRSVLVDYDDDGSIHRCVINWDPNFKGTGASGTYDCAEVIYYQGGVPDRVKIDSSNDKLYDREIVDADDGKIFAYIEAIFGKMEAKSEDE